MIRLSLTGADASVTETETLTAGRIGLECAFTFSSDWDGLEKVAVFEGAETIEVALGTANVAVVPPECMATAGYNLRCGAYGLSTEQAVVIPTVWAKAGKIKDSAAPDESLADFTPTLAAQVIAKADSAEETANTIAERASRGEFDGFSPYVGVSEIENGHRVSITDSVGTNEFDVMDGADGSPGAPGTPGADGYSPTVSVTTITGGHRVTITDASGAHSFDVMDGEVSQAEFNELSGGVGDLKSALTTEGGINSFAVDSYSPTWNIWDGSWGVVKANPVTGATAPYMVYGPIIPVTAGQYYSIGVVDNPLYSDLIKVIGVSWYDANNTRLSTVNVYPQGGYLKWMQAPTGAVKAVPYYNTNNGAVSLSVEQVQAANFKWFFATRIVNFTNRDSSGQYAIKADEWVPSFLVSADSVEHTVTHVISVGPTNSSFTSLRAALDAISENGYPSETNRFEVQIKEGTYDIASYFTAEEKASSNFVGLIVPDWVTLKGVGNREKTILQYVLETASNNICVLNLKNTCSLENLTLYGVKTRYCVHDDKANYVGTPYKRYCKNVHFKGDTMTLGAVYGAGINSNAEWTFKDCIFESLTQTGYQNCFSVHGSGQAVQVGSSSVTFNNCRFIGYGTNNSVILSTLMNNASYFQNYCKFMGCSANGRLILREENASSYGAGIAWWATGFATTFTDEIISNTDGVDYSDHIDII